MVNRVSTGTASVDSPMAWPYAQRWPVSHQAAFLRAKHAPHETDLTSILLHPVPTDSAASARPISSEASGEGAEFSGGREYIMSDIVTFDDNRSANDGRIDRFRLSLLGTWR